MSAVQLLATGVGLLAFAVVFVDTARSMADPVYEAMPPLCVLAFAASVFAAVVVAMRG